MVCFYVSLAFTGLVISSSFVGSANVPDLKMAKLDVDLMKEYLASQFIQATDDFETAQLNSVYFPLEKSVDGSDTNYDERRNSTDLFVHKYRGFQLATAERKASLVADFMHSLSSQNVTELSKITSWNTVLKEDLTRSALFILPASWRYLLADQVYDKVISNPRDWSDMVNLQPANLGFLFKAAQELRTEHEYYKGIQDKAEDLFAKSVKLPEAYEVELGYILAYRWGIQDLKRFEDEFSLENLVKLPADAVLAINEIYFDKVDLEQKLKDSEVFADKEEGEILPWFSLAQRYLGSTKLKNEFSDYKPLVLAAPLPKMVSMMEYVEDVDLMKIMTAFNLNPVRAQEIWKILVATDSAQSLEDLFFKIGHKLDIEQINTFYDNEFVNLYSHRHDLEVAWIGRTVNVPWSHVKHVSNRHFPTSPIDRWRPTDLINLGKFAVGLSFSALKTINPTAISGDTVEKIISPSMTKGQMCILYDVLRKKEELAIELPEELYACVEASVINGIKELEIKDIQPLTSTGLQALVRQSSRFSPAQKSALMSVLEGKLWKPEILSSILLHNPTLLAAVSNKEFREKIEAVRDAIVEAGIQNLPQVSNNILKLPRRLLTTWLEATVVITEFGKIDVDVLLDRPSSLRAHSTDSTEVAVNLLEHATGLDSLFPSLAISGLTCDMIAKIPAGEIVEVISALRFRIGEDAIIHSGTRKCLARAVRDYMFLKSELYNIAVSGEIELLSMLSTADIHAIGAEILLTWGGKVLSQITHPEVRKEVLQVVASDAPHIFFHSGVSFKDLKLMAKTLFSNLLSDNQNIVDLGVLKKMRDFLPYMDKVVEASAADIKMFISSVHTNFLSRGVCTSMNNRNLLRNMILKGYGQPETWTSLDLVQLGDFLITMTKSDLMKVSVESARRALPQLVDNSAYGILLPEVRGRSTPQLYYEACALWLNDGKDSDMGEGKAFVAAWRKLARWHLSGADLINLRNNPKEVSRVKREGEEEELDIEDTPDIDYRVLHDQVMKELMSRFKDLPKESAAKAVSIISETQELLGNGSLIVMGEDPTLQAYTQADVLNKIKAFKLGEEFTPVKEEQINKLALDSQVRLIQRLVTLLGLTAADLGVSAESIYHVKTLKAFQSVEEYVATAKYDFSTGTESSIDFLPAENSEVDDILLNDTIKEREIENFLQENPVPIDLEGITGSSSSKPGEVNDEVVTAATIAAEPEEVAPAVIKPVSIREVTVISLSCDDLRSAGRSATAINSRDINRMSTVELMNCLEYLGGLDFRAVDLPALWESMYIKLKKEKSTTSGQEMINLGKLLPVIAESTPSYLDMSENNFEAISVLGEHSSLLINVFLEENAKINLNEFEIISLGKMICGMSAAQWSSLINEQLMMKLLLPQIASLDCRLSPEVSKEVFSALKTGLTGLELDDTGSSLLSASSHVQELGWLLSLLSSEELARIPPLFMDQVSEYGILDELDLSGLDASQLANIAPQAASFISENQIQGLDIPQTSALLSAVGEDPVKSIEVETLLTRLQEAAEAAKAEEDEDTAEITGASTKRRGNDDSSAAILAPTLLLMLCSSVLL